MQRAQNDSGGHPAPLWIRRPAALHAGAYLVAGLVFVGQLLVVIERGSDAATVVGLLVAGAGAAASWWLPWTGLVLTSAASFAVTAVGEDRISVWMIAVLVLFSVTLRGKRPVLGTALVAAFFLAALLTVGGYRGGAVVAVAALFSAIAGGATGAALRLSREHWMLADERARSAVATREQEATRRVTEERLRIARDLHDVVGHQVAMLSVHLGVAEIGLPEQAASSRRALEDARSNARSVVSETQRILAVLRRGEASADGEALRPTPALSSLDTLIASFESIGLDVTASIALPDGEPDPVVGVTVYRIVQEALTNAYRHGEGAATVTVGETDDRLVVSVQNAIGHAHHEPSGGGGLGLVGMRERVESCGGILTAGPVDGVFRISAELSPLGARLA